MLAKDNALQLLVIEDSMNDIELLVSTLKNAGMAVRSTSAEDEEELQEAIKNQELDIILCSVDSEEPSLAQVHQAIAAEKKKIPVIATAKDLDTDLMIEVMEAGARDLVSREYPEHLQMVVQRESKGLHAEKRYLDCIKLLKESESRAKALLDSSRDAITYVHEGMHIYANQVYLDTFGFSGLDDIEGTPIMDMVSSDDHDKLKTFLRAFSKGDDSKTELEIKGLRPKGETFNALMEFSHASIEGEPCTQIIIRDQSINKELEKKLKFLSKQDPLTGLYNRQFFIDSLDRAVDEARKEGKTSAVLYLMPDNFRSVKENAGLAGADNILTEIATILKDTLDKTEVIARFGDNAFTILTHLGDTNIIMAVADKIRKAIDDHIFEANNQTIAITCSIGIGMVGETSENAQEVLSHADLACELAIHDGGNQVHLHNPIADQKASQERDQHWIDSIKNAIDNNLFTLAYQPIASLHGDTAEKYEVLVRMHNEEGEEILPGQFIPIAEEHGLITSIDRWVILNAAKALSQRRAAGNDTTFFIKISEASLTDSKLVPWLAELISKARLDGNWLVFEVFESAAANQIKGAAAFVEEIKKLNCQFCIEHFGKAPNSIKLLNHLPADFLKIDGSFMRNLASNEENQAMVKSISEVANAQGNATIAEFVEDASSLAVLWQCQVNFIQGNFLQKPHDMMDYDFEGDS
jgi:diguanylate cyclase (GGDEF)-like protein/PAS domain S-box-containing protein